MFTGEKRIRRVVLVGVAACAVLIGTAYPRSGQASPAQATAPSLGTAAGFAVLAASTVTNTLATTVNGSVGVFPGTAVTGFPPGIVVGGTIHAGDAVAAKAESDALTAYNNLGTQACTANLTGQDLGGKTLTPGVYCFDSSAQLTGAVTLDGQGNPAAVFIFKIGSTLTTASASSVVLINGASSCNVFWKVGSSATLGTGTALAGTILAVASVTMTTGATLLGRAIALNGAVTMDTNTISNQCAQSPVATATATALPATATAVAAATNTSIAAATNTALAIPTSTLIAAATNTAIAAATNTAVAIPTNTAIAAATNTAIAAATNTAVAIPTSTRIAAATNTAIAAATNTALAIPTHTAIPAATNTSIAIPTSTATATATHTAIVATATVTPTPGVPLSASSVVSRLTVHRHQGIAHIRWYSKAVVRGFNVYNNTTRLNRHLVTSRTHWYGFTTRHAVNHLWLAAIARHG